MTPGFWSPICAASTGWSDASIYNWTARLGGMDVSEVRRLKSREAKKAHLKRVLTRSDALTKQR